MGKPHFPSRALLLMGLLYSSEEYYIKALQSLCSHFGDIAMISPSIEWNFSNYYKNELGTNIIRRFIFFKELIDQGSISDIKIITNKIEDSLSTNNKRNINIDPGYLTLAKIVLASTKDYSHRIYLRNGIYAEVTLIFRKDSFVPHLNTYKDFQDERYLKIFMQARRLLKLTSH